MKTLDRLLRAMFLILWAMTVPTAAAAVWAGVAVWHVLVAVIWIALGFAQIALLMMNDASRAEMIRRLKQDTDRPEQDVEQVTQELHVFVSGDSVKVRRRKFVRSPKTASQRAQELPKQPSGTIAQGAARGGVQSPPRMPQSPSRPSAAG